MMRIHSHLDRPIRFLHLGRNSTKMYTKTLTNNSMANKFKINFIYPVSLDKTRRQLAKCVLKVQRQYLKVLSSKVTKTLKCKDNKCRWTWWIHHRLVLVDGCSLITCKGSNLSLANKSWISNRSPIKEVTVMLQIWQLDISSQPKIWHLDRNQVKEDHGLPVVRTKAILRKSKLIMFYRQVMVAHH